MKIWGFASSLMYVLIHVALNSSLKRGILRAEIDRCLKFGIYQSKVFFFENLGFIEHTEAQISYEDALIFEQIRSDVYKEFDFEIIMVPKGLTIAQR
jgi:predicted ATPase